MLADILIFQGFYPPKTPKHRSNAYYKCSLISPPKLLRPKKLWYLKVEIEWLLMNSCGEKLFPLLLADILIREGLFAPKPQNLGQINISNYLSPAIQNCLVPDNSGLWKLN